MIIPIILSGGSGTRLWPLSKKNRPKQYAQLIGKQTLLQNTITRLNGIPELTKPIIICNETHNSLITDQLSQIKIKPNKIILEPFGRNTAPAIAIATIYAMHEENDPILLVLPSDHAIADIKKFHKAINTAAEYAKQDNLVTFGIVPDRPETGYGYIRFANQLQHKDSYKLEKFVEKPDLETAKQYLATKKYYWNSGMFMFRASNFLTELQHYAPDIFAACQKTMDAAIATNELLALPKKEFSLCPNISIDYALMEKTKNGVVVALDAGWNDIGSWDSLWDYGEKDSNGNIIIGNVVAKNVNNSYIHASNRKIVTIGMKDHIIVETKEEILVIHKDYCQNIKELIEES